LASDAGLWKTAGNPVYSLCKTGAFRGVDPCGILVAHQMHYRDSQLHSVTSKDRADRFGARRIITVPRIDISRLKSSEVETHLVV
jgi:hypothetical protein